MDEGSENVQESPRSKKARKRETNLSTKIAETEKRLRYAQKPPTLKPPCNHTNGCQQCNTLTLEDITSFNQRYYSQSDKVKQDAFILKHTMQTPPQKTRKGETKFNHKYSVRYYITKSYSPNIFIQICKPFFLQILNVGKNRVNGVLSRYEKSGEAPVENRGGDRTSLKYSAKRGSVKTFIESLQVVQKHKCKSKEKNKQYLSSELNLNKLFEMYNNQCSLELTVKKTFFKTIFYTDYNLGFESPKTDVCSACEEHKNKTKNKKESKKGDTKNQSSYPVASGSSIISPNSNGIPEPIRVDVPSDSKSKPTAVVEFSAASGFA